MEHNPYAPPTAPVADIHGHSVIDNRAVLIACKIFWVSFGLSLLDTAVKVVSQPAISSVIGGIVGAALGFAITRWAVSKLKAGRNWMRLLVTVFTVLGFLAIPIFWKFYVTAVFPIYARNPIRAATFVVQMILNAWSTILLNLPYSRGWFAQQRKT